MEILINAENLILGRFASYAAKQALLGNKVNVVNCEKAIVTGKRKTLIKHYKEKYERGDALKGPFLPRVPDKLVRRVIRGMLPHRQYKGKTAFKLIKCYIGVPEELKNKKPINLKDMGIDKLKNLNYITIKEVSKSLGR